MSTAESSDILSSTIRREGHPRRFQRGQALFTEGDLAGRVFLIERGWVTVTCTTPGGREIMLALRGPGDMLGELSALDGKPRSATAMAVSEVEAAVVSGSTLTRTLDEARASRELIRMLASRLRDSDRKRLEFATLDTLGRVAWRLLELSDRFGRETNEGISVGLPLSQEQLAGWCGASRESTVKALTSLRELGTITTGRRQVLIRDPEALRRHARGTV
jgi:CRP/FNR family cyclic AMP-dependent transcriptional regulator